jgi:hypothetical protein
MSAWHWLLVIALTLWSADHIRLGGKIDGLQIKLEQSELEVEGLIDANAKLDEASKRVRTAFEGHLNACLNDYKKLSDSFDSYRKIIAKSQSLSAIVEGDQSCLIGGENALIDALNNFND